MVSLGLLQNLREHLCLITIGSYWHVIHPLGEHISLVILIY